MAQPARVRSSRLESPQFRRFSPMSYGRHPPRSGAAPSPPREMDRPSAPWISNGAA